MFPELFQLGGVHFHTYGVLFGGNDGLKLISSHSARTLNVQDRYGIEVGKPANLLILPAENGFDAVRRQVPVRYSIRHGKVIAQTRPAQTEIVLGQPEPIDFRR